MKSKSMLLALGGLLTATALTACSGHSSVANGLQPPSPPTGARATPGLYATLSPLPTPLLSSTAPPRVSSGFGVAQKIAPGYTGKSYINRLAKSWHIMFKETRDKLPDGTTLISDWGTVRISSNNSLTLASVGDASGQLYRLICDTTGTGAKTSAFLADCARLDTPGSSPDAAESWVKSALNTVRHTYARSPGWTATGPLYRTRVTVARIEEAPSGAPGNPKVDLMVQGVGK